MSQPQGRPGWYPAGDGAQSLWYWDGYRWIDPMVEFENCVGESLRPIIENVYKEGFKHGTFFASRACQTVSESFR